MSYEQSTAQPLTPENERLYSTLIHVGGIVIGVISPIIGYLLLKDRGVFVRDNARNALNFQITITIAAVVAYILTAISFGILFFLPLAVAVVNVVFSIIAAVAANRGEVYRYPLTIAFVK
ncbi:DUF4870 domain-containing protein [Amnibacterium endophyticum]|uniref:DUF4870 domain-containing protein n=1 Tax=Amnibacterium endophyticum TaxID=2109337 RepID=A0ABW4LG90_9MICO